MRRSEPARDEDCKFAFLREPTKPWLRRGRIEIVPGIDLKVLWTTVHQTGSCVPSTLKRDLADLHVHRPYALDTVRRKFGTRCRFPFLFSVDRPTEDVARPIAPQDAPADESQ